MSCSEQCEIRNQLNNALARLAELEQENARKEIELNWMREQFRLNKQRQFGHSKDSSPEQLALFHFNEAEVSSNPKVEEPELTVQPAKASSRKRKPPREREAIWEKLPRVRTVHKLPEEELVCPECGDVRRKMSEEVRRELRVIPAQFYVEEIVQEVYVCDGCQREGEHSPIATAEAPKPPIAKSFASAALLAYVATLKYCDGLPLHRMEQMFKRMDLDIRRQNLSNWMIQISELWLKLLHDELHRHLLTRDIVHSDDYRNSHIIETHCTTAA